MYVMAFVCYFVKKVFHIPRLHEKDTLIHLSYNIGSENGNDLEIFATLSHQLILDVFHS